MQKEELPQEELKKIFYSENVRRSQGGKKWVKWKPPKWATEYDTFSFDLKENLVTNKSKLSKRKCFRDMCSQKVKQNINFRACNILQTYVDTVFNDKPSTDKAYENFSESKREGIVNDDAIHVPFFIKPNDDLLRASYKIMESFLPKGDCEDFDVMKIAESYYSHWRPKQVKVILLAESHVFTERQRALEGPGLDPLLMKQIRYNGPTKHISLIYSLTYGENDAFDTKRSMDEYEKKRNMGTPHFWSILAACSRGTNKTFEFVSKNCSKKLKTKFSADLMKQGGLSCEERLTAKLKILNDLKTRGIWLIDTSLLGWYIPQPQMYKRSTVTNDVHKVSKVRPPKKFKAPALKLSWESYTKHVVREVVNEGYLKLIVPIGMEVGKTIGKTRFMDAVESKHDSDTKITLAPPFPAPNAFIPGKPENKEENNNIDHLISFRVLSTVKNYEIFPMNNVLTGGYGQFYDRIADMVHKAAPPVT